MRPAAQAAALVLLTQAAHAGPPDLVWPVQCVLGDTCYIEDYVDRDPSSGQTDYACGIKSRDGHRGTDIVLQSFELMDRGVPVLAAAAGRVVATRDGEPDIAISPDSLQSVSDKECGNAVELDHGDGWHTLYCHMRKESVLVRQGNRVQAGEPLGLVGLSGMTNIPHLHFTTLKNGRVIDPFAPSASVGAACGSDDTSLWAEPPAYQRAGFYSAGMTTQIPSFEDVKSGAARKLKSRPDEPLVVYGYMFYAETGDVMQFSVKGSNGTVFSHSQTLKDPKLSQFQAFGRKAPAGGWPEGDYRGIVRLERDGTLIAWRHADITVTSR